MEHIAVVENVEPGWVGVVIRPQSACSACAARQVCGTGEGDERRIMIHTDEAEEYAVGEEVAVSVERVMGMRAVAISYIYPFLLMLAILLVLLGVGASEALAGLSALGSLAVYYIVVRQLRGKIEKQIVFTISKRQ